jgi:hypothetical protein
MENNEVNDFLEAIENFEIIKQNEEAEKFAEEIGVDISSSRLEDYDISSLRREDIVSAPRRLEINEEFKELIPPLNTYEYKLLEENILDNGITDDIQIWNSFIIDGHNRYEIAQKHNLTFNTKELEFDNEEDVKIYIIEKQMGRRNITNFVRLELLESLEEILTKKAKKNQGTRTDICPNLDKSKIDNGEYLDDFWNIGKPIPPIITPINVMKEVATIAGVSRGTKWKFDKIKNVIDDDTKRKLRMNEVAIDNVFKEVKAQEKQQKVIEYAKKGESVEIKNELVDLRYGDFSKVLDDIPDNSIDLILTDPPYPHQYIDEWTKLGEFAQKKLKDGGFLIAYSGHMYLPEVINNVLKSGINWYWLGSCLHGVPGTGKVAQVFEVNMFAKHKPILFFQKGKKQKQDNWTEDVFVSEVENKDFHTWGQSVPIFDKLIKVFQPEIVVDPFMGGGTTAIACMMNGVKCIGADNDEIAYNTSKKRISEYEI